METSTPPFPFCDTSLESGDSQEEHPAAHPVTRLSTIKTVLITASLTSLTLVNSLSSGLLTVGLPQIALDLTLPGNLLLWPATVNALATSCCLLTAGAVADIVGKRLVSLLGSLIHCLFTLACGLSRSGFEMILFRAFQGMGAAMIYPTSVGILSEQLPEGRTKNIGLSCLGFGVPLGYAIGLILGGLFQSTSIGWPLGFYVCAALMFILFFLNLGILPQGTSPTAFRYVRLWNEIDWIGLLISSTCLGLFSYILAAISQNKNSIRLPHNIVILCFVGTSIPAFIVWMHFQEHAGKPALIPNSLWKNGVFSTICTMVLLSWAMLNSMEWFFSLYFQEVQHLNPLDASIRFLPDLLFGVFLNIMTGLLVHKLPVMPLATTAAVFSAMSPLIMAVIDPTKSYWLAEFWAMLLLPSSADIVFTVATVIITNAFPPSTQALAGAVFNAISQLGTSLGIAIMAAISSSVSASASAAAPSGIGGEGTSADILLPGFRAVFWSCFGLGMGAVIFGAWALRGLGRIASGAGTEG